MPDKPFRTHNQQLKILRKRGMGVPTTGQAKRVLERKNYYNLINGYKDLFEVAGLTESYKTGTQFREVVALYNFDFELRHALLKPILQIETHVKSRIAYRFSQQYGHDNYLKLANFDLGGGARKRLKHATEIVQALQKDIAHQVIRQGPVQHYMVSLGYVPLWVLINFLSLGTVSKFYSGMKQTDRQSISKVYRISDDAFGDVLSLLTLVRNKCAHSERIYNFRSPRIAIQDHDFHTRLGILRGPNGFVQGKQDLLAVLIALKILLDRNDFRRLTREIDRRISMLDKGIEVIASRDVLAQMGLVANWKQLASI